MLVIFFLFERCGVALIHAGEGCLWMLFIIALDARGPPFVE